MIPKRLIIFLEFVAHTYWMPYAAALLLSFFFTYILTRFFRGLSISLNIIDSPSERKIHRKPTPLLGGLAIYGGFITAFIVGVMFWPGLMVDYLHRFFSFFLAGFITILMGVYDDIRGSGARFKFFSQVVVGLVLFFGGIRIEFLTNPLDDSVFVLPIWFSCFLTVFWVSALCNAFNLIDGLDGLVSGITLIASLSLAAISLYRGEGDSAYLLFALAGASAAFLRFNFYPASIFMGDTGSLFLGFCFAAISIKTVAKGAIGMSLLVPLAIFCVPIFDTFIAILRRTALKKSPFKADRKHIHHQLLSLGFSQRQAVFLLYLATLYACLLSLLTLFLSRQEAFLLLVSVPFLLAFGIFSIRSAVSNAVKRKEDLE